MRINPKFKRPPRELRGRARRVEGWRSAARRLVRDQQGATTLEWCMLLAAIAIPSYWIFKTCLATLVGHYHIQSMLNSLPFP